jgi:glycine oxidase
VTPTPDVLIAGGGVIGLSIAYALAREGAGVTIVDRGQQGGGASWAGAGIIAPRCATTPADPLEALRHLSALAHAEWADALRAETGIDNGFRICGGLDVALDGAEARELAGRRAAWRSVGIAFESLDADDLRRIEPTLGPELVAAIHLPDRAQIRNPRHLRALRGACDGRGVSVIDATIEGFEVRGDRIVTAHTTAGTLPCGEVVVAAGAWSEPLLRGLGLDVPTPPVKGQIVLLNAGERGPRRIIEHGSCYLVPRDDGRVLVGATEEHVGFDARPTPPGVRGLLDEALRLCPALADAEVERAWAGLRPGSRDGRPYIGRVPGWANLTLAAGHLRAGLQLSTGTALLVADLLLGRPARVPRDAFRPDRAPAQGSGLFRS